MSQEYYPFPLNTVTFAQIRNDVEQGKIRGLTLYQAEKPEKGVFYIDDIKGNTLGVFKINGIVVFKAFNLNYNNAEGILKRLMKHYNFKVKIEGLDAEGLFGADDIGDESVVGDGSFNAVPLEFEGAFKSGTWRKVRKQTRKKNLSCSRISKVR